MANQLVHTTKKAFKRLYTGHGLKIFYAVQATGNGHIARAIELLPYLRQYGEVDVFLSGSNSTLATAALPVKYRSRGISLFYHTNGGLSYGKIFKEAGLLRMYAEAKQLPVENYDIVINDFESITSLACSIKRMHSVSFGHQASFKSFKTPRPAKKSFMGELLLKYYATAHTYTGLHFERYDDFIFNPIVKHDILTADAKDNGHITVYLAHYADEVVAKYLKTLPYARFEVFSKTARQASVDGNITFIPVNSKAFNDSMVHCSGMVTGAGFETPAEVLYLGKKLLCIPIKGQYEQLCNAEALKNFNVPVFESMDEKFAGAIEKWLGGPAPKPLLLRHSAAYITEHVIDTALNHGKNCHEEFLPLHTAMQLQ